MRKLLFTVALALPMLYFAQETSKETQTTSKECELPADFKEPIKNNRLKKFIAIDNVVQEKDVIIIQAQNGYGSGIYNVCVKGKLMKYKKVGTVFMREGTNPFEGAK